MKHDYGFSAARERIVDELFMMISCQLSLASTLSHSEVLYGKVFCIFMSDELKARRDR